MTKTVLITHQCLGSLWAKHSIKVSSFFVGFSPHSACTASRLGVHTKLGGHTTRTAEPNWSREYFILNDTVPSNKSLGKMGWGEGAQAFGTRNNRTNKKWAYVMFQSQPHWNEYCYNKHFDFLGYVRINSLSIVKWWDFNKPQTTQASRP